MGFFSWKTSCSNESIPNVYSGKRTFPVLMVDDKGNTYLEEQYDGYGVFGGKDFYQLVAEMNIPEKCNGNKDHDRSLGIDLVFDSNPSGDIDMESKMVVKIPILVRPNKIIETYSKEDFIRLWKESKPPLSCESQGYFY